MWDGEFRNPQKLICVFTDKGPAGGHRPDYGGDRMMIVGDLLLGPQTECNYRRSLDLFPHYTYLGGWTISECFNFFEAVWGPDFWGGAFSDPLPYLNETLEPHGKNPAEEITQSSQKSDAQWWAIVFCAGADQA